MIHEIENIDHNKHVWHMLLLLYWSCTTIPVFQVEHNLKFESHWDTFVHHIHHNSGGWVVIIMIFFMFPVILIMFSKLLIISVVWVRVRPIQPYRYRYGLSESYRYPYGLFESYPYRYRYRKKNSFLANTDTRCFNRYHTNVRDTIFSLA